MKRLLTPIINSTLAACGVGMMPDRNVRDVYTEIVRPAHGVATVSFSSPNNVRVGAQARVRMFEDGRREPMRGHGARAYVPPQVGAKLPIDFSAW